MVIHIITYWRREKLGHIKYFKHMLSILNGSKLKVLLNVINDIVDMLFKYVTIIIPHQNTQNEPQVSI